MRRRAALASLALATTAVLAGCGDDAEPGDDAGSPATSSATSSATGEAGSPSPSASADGSPGESTTAGPTVPANVQDVADKLGCDPAAGTAGVDGETEYLCDSFLIADWNSAGVTEEEMFDTISQWVDEQRPVWLYAGDKVLVYGTEDELNEVADAFE